MRVREWLSWYGVDAARDSKKGLGVDASSLCRLTRLAEGEPFLAFCVAELKLALSLDSAFWRLATEHRLRMSDSVPRPTASLSPFQRLRADWGTRWHHLGCQDAPRSTSHLCSPCSSGACEFDE